MNKPVSFDNEHCILDPASPTWEAWEAVAQGRERPSARSRGGERPWFADGCRIPSALVLVLMVYAPGLCKARGILQQNDGTEGKQRHGKSL